MIGRDDTLSVQEAYKFFVIISVCLGSLIAVPLICCPHWILNVLNWLSVLHFISTTITLETIFQSTLGVILFRWREFSLT